MNWERRGHWEVRDGFKRRKDLSGCGWAKRSREKEDILSRGRVQCGMQLKLENHTGNGETGNPARCQSMESALQRVGHRREVGM